MSKKDNLFDLDIQVSSVNDNVQPMTFTSVVCTIKLITEAFDCLAKPAPHTLLTCNPDPQAPCANGGQTG